MRADRNSAPVLAHFWPVGSALPVSVREARNDEIRRLASEGATRTQISESLRISKATISRVLRVGPASVRESRSTPEARFWEKVDRRGHDDCWEWTAAVKGFGYGALYLSPGKAVSAHRFSWVLAFGEIPDGLQVLHRCDNPRCCNPAHLFLGTNEDNHADKTAKGRWGGKGPDRSRSLDLTRSRRHY